MMKHICSVCLGSLLLAMLVWTGCAETSSTPAVNPGTTVAAEGTQEDFETLTEGDLEVVAVQPELTKSEERGLMIFRHYCAHCHGPTGEGDGQNSYGLDIPPRDLLTLELDGERTDEELRQVITEGGAATGFSPLMPPWGHTFESNRIDDLVALIHILPELEPVEEEGQSLSLDEDAGMDDFSL